jgi:2-amino-4-hydroxy-6-hydroxymethyldihydropteridine diphosphokinase
LITSLTDTRKISAVVALGANLGDAWQMVHQAIQDMSALPETCLIKASSCYRTAPLQALGPDFINAVVQLETELSAHRLLTALQALEHAAGRTRSYHNAPRTLDLDVIFYGDLVLTSPELTVPHPRWRERAFVLLPLAEICPDLVSPAMLHAVRHQEIHRIDKRSAN